MNRQNTQSPPDLAHSPESVDTALKFALHDPSTIAAVIVEPVARSTGVLLPPKCYLQRLRELCDRHGIMLIFDEVITTFCLLGTATALADFDVTPDITTMAKGLTNAAAPMGAVAVHRRIFDSTLEHSKTAIELFHGYTYSAHPLACAAALATLDTYSEERLFARAAELAPQWEQAVHTLRDCPNVIDIRNLGLVAAIELSPQIGTPGDTIGLSPQLIISPDQIDHLFTKLAAILHELA